MDKKVKFVPTVMVTRKARRAAAKFHMRSMGYTRLFKKFSTDGEARASKFAREWRNFVF